MLFFGAQAVHVVRMNKSQPLPGPGEGRAAVDLFKIAADPEPAGSRVPVPDDHPRGAEGQFEPLLLDAQFLFHPLPVGDVVGEQRKQVSLRPVERHVKVPEEGGGRLFNVLRLSGLCNPAEEVLQEFMHLRADL
ncbi:hypothetical protein DSECCO2_586670 [anaerobic digester metagenome]